MTSKTLCILFSDSYEAAQNPLASERTLATVPFGGRYCLVDFVLSSLVKSGLHNIGVLTKGRYGSLVDHLGWGKDWDLNRKDGGIKILTPFADADTAATRDRSRIDALLSCRPFLEQNSAEHVLLCDSNLVMNIDFSGMLSFHADSGAEITALYHKRMEREFSGIDLCCNHNGEVTDANFCFGRAEDGVNQLLNVFLFRKELLLELLSRAYTFGWSGFVRDFITRSIGRRRVMGFEHKGFCRVIDTAADYYAASMELLEEGHRKDLFSSGTDILTNVKNTAPALYGFDSKTRNSLVADGCRIDGQVENSILFRGVTVAAGAKVKDSILFAKTVVEENASVSSIIADKNTVIGRGKLLAGQPSYPIVLKKGAVV